MRFRGAAGEAEGGGCFDGVCIAGQEVAGVEAFVHNKWSDRCSDGWKALKD